MPDNVAITPGAGASIATDDVSGVQYQRVKLDVGGNGLAVPVEHTESMMPVGVFNKKVTNTRVGVVSSGDSWIVAVPAGSLTFCHYMWQSVGSGLNGLNTIVYVSYDGGTTYINASQGTLYIGSAGAGAFGSSYGGSGLPIRGVFDCVGATHLKVTINVGIGSGATLSEAITFYPHPFRSYIESSGVSVVSSYIGNPVNSGGGNSNRFFPPGGAAYDTEFAAVGAYGDGAWMVHSTWDRTGRQVVAPYALPGQLIRSATAAETGTSNREIFAALGSNVRAYVTAITWSNDSTVDTEVEIRDGASTVIYTFFAKQKSGGTITLPTPFRGSSNTVMNFANLTTGSAVKLSVTGYKSTA